MIYGYLAIAVIAAVGAIALWKHKNKIEAAATAEAKKAVQDLKNKL